MIRHSRESRARTSSSQARLYPLIASLIFALMCAEKCLDSRLHVCREVVRILNLFRIYRQLHLSQRSTSISGHQSLVAGHIPKGSLHFVVKTWQFLLRALLHSSPPPPPAITAVNIGALCWHHQQLGSNKSLAEKSMPCRDVESVIA